MKRTLLAVLLLTVAQDALSAQIIRPVRRDNPVLWTSLSVGFLQQQGVCDPTTNACWDFGSGFPQWRGTIEVPVGSATLGVAGTMSRVPLRYSGTPFAERSCASCDAEANISQLLANFRIGGGSGFHQVIDLSAGYTFFHNFRQTDGTALGSSGAVTDFTFGLGYGFGYNFTSRAQLIVVQDLGLLIHKRQSGNVENVLQQRTTRVGFRYGMGNRSTF